MKKMHKILIPTICVLLIFSVILGLATRSSFVKIDSDDAIYRVLSQRDDEDFINEDCKKSTVLKQLEKVKNVFAVTVKSTENTYQTTKTTVVIDNVIKGDAALKGKTAVIYEPNFFDYYRSSKNSFYRAVNYINNSMREDSRYLVFCDDLVYVESYKKSLTNPEFKINVVLILYSFPLEGEIGYIKNAEDTEYSNVNKYDYFCFSQAEAEHIDSIRKEVFGKYL